MKRIATFVHISDLHIGELDPITDDARLDAHTEPWLTRWSLFDGYLGHAGLALRHVNSFFDSMRMSEDANLIVTGDLTTVGGDQEAKLAEQFLTQTRAFPGGAALGLGVASAFDLTIPGNHDHWPGQRAKSPLDFIMFGPQPSLTRRFHRNFPCIHRMPIRKGTDLVFVCLDSDSDVPPKGQHRLLARGRFDSQLSKAEKMLGLPKKSEVRVMLIHHSPSKTGVKLAISQRMRAALVQSLDKMDIRVILTGHVHTVGAVQMSATHPMLEARCGTTTQRDTVPPGWKNRKLDQNTLLVHRLFEQITGGPLFWEVESFMRTGKGFVSTNKYFGSQKIPVWP